MGEESKRKVSRDVEAGEDVVEAPAKPSGKGERLAGEIDDLMEEIDQVLEENAEEFVRNYIQKGGE